MNTPPRASFAERLLQRLAEVVCHHPRWFIYPQAVFVVACIYYTVFSSQHLEFDASRNNLVGAGKKYHQNFLEYKKEFPGQDDLVVVVESDQLGKNRQFVERLGARLEAETNLFTDVFYKGDLKLLGNKALLFTPEADLRELLQQLKDYRPFIQTFSRATNLVSLFQLINKQFLTAKQEDNAENQSLVKAIPALERIVSEATDSLNRPGTPPSPGVTALFGGGPEAEQQMYITFAEGRIYLVTAQARREGLNGDAVHRLRELVRQIQQEVPGVNVGVTGEPVLEVDEMQQSERDMALATVVSFALVFVIIIFGYGKIGRRIKADACLIVGLSYSMAFTTLAIGHLNILTITFAPILIGIAIDFGVHLIARYEEELQNGVAPEAAMRRAMILTGQGIFTGAFTTAGAFLAMGFTDFKGIQEMGIISGGGLLISLVPMMTMLPALLLLERQSPVNLQSPPPVDRRAQMERLWLDRPWLVVGVTMTLCALALVRFPRVQFDYNLLNMQSAELPAVVFEKKLINSASNSVLFGAVMADDLPAAVALEAKLTNLTTVANVKSMSSFLAADQSRKLALVREVKQVAAAIHFPELDPRPVNVTELSSETLYAFQGYLGQAAVAVEKEGDVPLQKQLLSLRSAIDGLRTRMNADRPQAATKLAAFQYALLDDLHGTFAALRNQDDRTGLRAQDLPPALRNRFVGQTGKYLIQVYPREDVWQRGHQQAFVNQLRTVDENVTGTPVQLLEYTDLLKSSYEEAAWYSLGAIAILVFIHFRSLTCVVLALLPVGIGAIWMIGFMGWFGILLNPANIMTLPLVIGIGVTNGIHILNRFAEENNPGILAKSTGKAVLVSGLTTIAGFGSLILAKHQGIQSLGYVMAVGTATCMMAALTFLPALLSLMMRRGWSLKKTQRQ